MQLGDFTLKTSRLDVLDPIITGQTDFTDVLGTTVLVLPQFPAPHVCREFEPKARTEHVRYDLSIIDILWFRRAKLPMHAGLWADEPFRS